MRHHIWGQNNYKLQESRILYIHHKKYYFRIRNDPLYRNLHCNSHYKNPSPKKVRPVVKSDFETSKRI